jgi:hypothetical protein
MDPQTIAKLLDVIHRIETEAYTVQATEGLRKEYPQTFQVLEDARGLLRLAFVKLSEGDRQQ